jgi:hypothetical protein
MKLVSIIVVVLIVFLASCKKEDVGSKFPTNGLVAHYTFVGGKAADLVGANNGVLSGTITVSTDRFSNAQEAMTFDSSDDLIKVSNPTFLSNTQGTFMAWVKFTNLDHVQYVASVGDEGSIESYISFLRFDPANKTIGIYQRETAKANWVRGTTEIQEGIYYHLVMVSNGTSWSIFINGKKEDLILVNGTNTGKWIGQLTSIDNFVIGNAIILPPYTIPYFSGNIDEVWLYDRALSISEIQSVYTNTKL